MKNYINTLRNCPLFFNFTDNEIYNAVNLSKPKIKKYSKNEFVFSAENSVSELGIVLSGNVSVIKEDFWGNRAILTKINQSEIFGEAFALIMTDRLPVSVISNNSSEIMFLDSKKITELNSKLITNLLQIFAQKNIMLTQKIEHLIKRTTKEKVLSYLSAEAQSHKSNAFFIPFSRSELADYLSVDRSALSRELCRLRDSGILRFNKNHFELLKQS